MKELRSNNTSNITGVSWINTKQRWKVSICFKGKYEYLGIFQSFTNAVMVRYLAEREHGIHTESTSEYYLKSKKLI